MMSIARLGAMLAALAAVAVAVVVVVADDDEADAPRGSGAEPGAEAEDEDGDGEPADSPERPPPVRLTVSASGDILIHSPVYARALANGGGSEYDFEPMFAPIEPRIRRADLSLCHVETSMSEASPPSGYPLFNSPPSLASAISATGWDACTTASNHSVDLGEEGVDGTIDSLERARIEHTGTYASARASRRPLLLEHRGATIAVLSYTTDLNGLIPPTPWAVNLVEDPATVIADADRAVARGADAVIVNMHWSSGIVPEYTHVPSAAQREFASALARSGAITAIVGQGPHVVQPIERIAGTYVVFSEGNLISAQGLDSGLPAASQDGLIAFLELVVRGDRARVKRVRYLPIWVSHPDYAVLPRPRASADGAYERVVEVIGRGDGIAPLGASG
jgi:poly-gamma-glutamate capsule biosynthesis protein CapA/YwtB (metallophosphatase superfamily)